MVIRINRRWLATVVLALALLVRLALAAAQPHGARAAQAGGGSAATPPAPQTAQAAGGGSLPVASATVPAPAAHTAHAARTAGTNLPATDAAVRAMLSMAPPDLPATAAGPTTADPPPPADLARNIHTAAQHTGLPADLIAAVIMAESNGDPAAVSPAGAQGLMQLLPPTANWLGVSDAFDPAQNVAAGADYLASLLRQFMARQAGCTGEVVPSDTGTGPCPSPLIEALAAYNAGPHAVTAYGGVPPYPETQRYIAQVLANFAAYSAP